MGVENWPSWLTALGGPKAPALWSPSRRQLPAGPRPKGGLAPPANGPAVGHMGGPARHWTARTFLKLQVALLGQVKDQKYCRVDISDLISGQPGKPPATLARPPPPVSKSFLKILL